MTKRETFYRDLSIETGFDVRTVASVYTSLICLISKRLRREGKCKLPDLGDFTVFEHKLSGRYAGTNQVTKAVRFKTDYKLKQHAKFD